MATKIVTAPGVAPLIVRTVLRRCLLNETGRAMLLLVAVLHVCFWPYIWGDRTFLSSARDVPSVLPSGAWQGKSLRPVAYAQLDPGAPGWLSEPYAKLIQHQYLVEKTPPVWNPYQGYGAPLAASMQPQPFNPLYAVMALISSPRTYNCYILARLLLAGLFAFWFFRLLTGSWAAMAGAITYMLSGYFILYITMPHLSVDILAAAALLGVELLLVRVNWSGIAITGAVTWLAIVGGMPESAFLILAFSYLYFAFRVAAAAELRHKAGRHFCRLICASAFGLALSAFLLLPFLEFMHVSFDTHQPRNVGGGFAGLGHDGFGLSICTYLTPLLFGAPWNNILGNLTGHSGVRGYFGVVPLLLVLFALIAARRRESSKLHRQLVLFFAVAVVVMEMKRYGAPLVNWIGALPVAQLVRFEKYQESLLALAIAALAAIGTQYAVDRRVGPGSLAIALAGALSSLGLTGLIATPSVVKHPAYDHLFFVALGWALVLLLLVSIIIFVVIGWMPRTVRLLRPTTAVGILVLCFVSLEMSTNFILPMYYYLNRLHTTQDNPFVGAPYIDYLRRSANSHERVFGSDATLFPNWAAAFQLFDIRNLDAMYYHKYFTFLRTFLQEVPPNELVDRFTGNGGEYEFKGSLEQRLLQLSSVQWLVRQQPYLTNRDTIRSILDQNRGRILPGYDSHINETYFSIDGDSRPVLFQHPPYERLPYSLTVDKSQTKLHFAVAMNPAVFGSCGDGVGFQLEAQRGTGPVERLFEAYIDPKHNTADRRWAEHTVDLSRYAGKEIRLLFTTSPGPKGDTCADWAGWGAIRFGESASEALKTQLVYDHEAKIYRIGPTLPRAAVFHHAVIGNSEDDTLRILSSLNLDVLRTVVLNGAELDQGERARVATLTQSGVTAGGADIELYESTRVRIKARMSTPGLLMLNDTMYPGWKVYVDGTRSRMLTADYLFRGVFLDPGEHVVEFRYESDAYRYGSGVSAIALAGGSVWTGLLIRKRRLTAGAKRAGQESS